MRHPTVSAWQRQEDGSYAAEINGWALRVVWHPEGEAEGHGPSRGFSWAAEHEGKKLASSEIFEEIEVAMAHAEEQADPAPSGATEPAAEAATAGDHGHHH
jgi:hypothetical protein